MTDVVVTSHAEGLVLLLSVLLVAALVGLLAMRRALASANARKSEIGVELMRVRNSLMHSEDSLDAGRHPRFAARWSDVFVVTYPKCGTTWMQGIVQALRSKCDLDFGEITEEMPWDILALDCKQDLNAEQRWHPRVFKSHEAATSVARGGRYIYVSRDPIDALVSFWRFLPSYVGLVEGDISLEDFAEAVYGGSAASVSGQIWHHQLSWWRQRHEPTVLWVCFEDLVADLPTEVTRVAEFLCIRPGQAREALVAAVTAQSTMAAMSARAERHHWDDHFVRAHVLPRMRVRVPQGASTAPSISKVRQGGGKVGYTVPLALRARFAAKWDAIIGVETGLRDYAAMCQALQRERAELVGEVAAVAQNKSRGGLRERRANQFAFLE